VGKLGMLKVTLHDGNGGQQQQYKISLSPRGVVVLVSSLITLVTAGVLLASRIRQIPINSTRITTLEKLVFRSRACLSGNQALLEALIRKEFPNDAEVIISQAKETEKTLEKELEIIYTKEVK
jgi:hypothetical protein